MTESLKDLLDRDLASILKGKDLVQWPPNDEVFNNDTLKLQTKAEEYWKLRAHLEMAGSARAVKMCEYYRQLSLKTQRKADSDADQASIREKKLRDRIAERHEMLAECADDLESYVNAEYPLEMRDNHPSIERRYLRDMELVLRVRNALTKGAKP